tara:strand:+ start:412 stop:1233 length:822 start_codon:yes stop_codon:yes gene_type:complete
MMQNNQPIWMNKPIKPIRLFVGTPVHSNVSMHYTQTMLELQKECIKRNIKITFQLMKSSLVTQGRNLCVSYFLNTDCTHMLFVDSDIAFDPECIFRLLELDKEIISIPYPMKTAQWDTLMMKIKGGFISEPEQCEHHMLQYPLLIKDDNKDIKIHKGVIEATHCPTGCMMIKREVFDKLKKAYPNREIVQKTTIDGKYMDRPHFYNYFDTYYDPKTKRYLGEDFAFCKLWSDIGGKLYCYIMSYITHVGDYQYKGRLYDEMTNLEVENTTDQG